MNAMPQKAPAGRRVRSPGDRTRRETEDLKKQKHGIKLIGAELQIVPDDNHKMLHRLRKAVEEVITVTISDPKFLAPAAKLPAPREDEG